MREDPFERLSRPRAAAAAAEAGAEQSQVSQQQSQELQRSLASQQQSQVLLAEEKQHAEQARLRGFVKAQQAQLRHLGAGAVGGGGVPGSARAQRVPMGPRVPWVWPMGQGSKFRYL